jgi:SPOR domain
MKELFFYLLAACLCWQSASALAEQKLHRNDWYLSQPEENATIQMSGHESESGAIAYIEKSNLSGDIGYYQTEYKNMPWYAVTYGNFNTLDEARSRLELLPEELQQHAPWPRTFKAIRSLIDAKGLTDDSTAKSANKSQGQESAISNKPLLELNWEQGQAAYDDGDYNTAFNIWQVLAEQGDELSRFNLGVMYSRGEGTEKSSDKALK